MNRVIVGGIFLIVIVSIVVTANATLKNKKILVGQENQTPATVITYPGSDEIPVSRHYSVKVNDVDSFTCLVNGWESYGYGDYNSWKTVSWTNFAFSDGRVKIEVITDCEKINTAVVRPLSLGIVPIIDGNKITFSLDRPCKISVEIDEKYEDDKLFIFADGLEVDPPNKDDPGVDYFEPGTHRDTDYGPGVVYFDAGVHYISENSVILSNTTIYLAGGAYVYGSFRNRDKGIENVKIIGRGALCGTHLAHRDGTGLIALSARKLAIEGIIMVDSPGYNISVGTPRNGDAIADNTFANIKIIGMRLNADGIGASGDGITINDVFIYSYDDAIDIGSGKYNTRISDCVLYMEKASALKISWNSYGCGNIHVKDIDIIHYDTDSDYMTNEAVIFANHSTPAVVGDILMENITIETMNGSNKRFLGMWIRTSIWDPEPDFFGSIKGITIRNLNIMCETWGNHIFGLSSEHMIEDITFENLTINGRRITNAKDANITLNEFTDNIRFE